MREAVALLVLAWLFGAAASRAAQPLWPVLDTDAVPYLKAQGRHSYADFLLMNLPRAVAVASNGAYGWYGGGSSIEDVRDKALKSCADKGGAGCAIYAEDLQVVWQGRAAQALPPIPGPLIGSAARPHRRPICRSSCGVRRRRHTHVSRWRSSRAISMSATCLVGSICCAICCRRASRRRW
jgi:hypothetical protein